MSARTVLTVTLVALLLSGCDLLFPPSALETAMTRCDLDVEPTDAYLAASARLIDAAEAGRLTVASDRWLVAYRADPLAARSDTAQSDAARSEASRSDAGRSDAGRSDTGRSVAPPGSASARLAAAASNVRASYGLELARSVAPGLDLVRPSGDPAATARRLLADPRVRYVHPDVVLAPATAPASAVTFDDELFSDQWPLTAFGLPAAWTVEQGREGVTVAVLDTAFDLDHPDLAGRFVDGYDFYNRDPDPGAAASGAGTSLARHGTHVAGIVAATGGNDIGTVGVTPTSVRIVPVQIFDDAGGDAEGRALEALIAGLRWTAGLEVAGVATRAEPVDVANLSLGTQGAYDLIPALEDAVRDARRAGVLVLAAAGNEGTDRGVIAPANGPCAVAIGSVDEDRALSSFSNYAADERLVDLVGPGGSGLDESGVLSTVPDDSYGDLTGTSMSTPWVSGVAALLASREPGWTDEDLLSALLSGAWRPPDGTPAAMGFGLPCPDALLGLDTICGR